VAQNYEKKRQDPDFFPDRRDFFPDRRDFPFQQGGRFDRNANVLEVFLYAQFKSNNSGLSSITSHFKKKNSKSSLILFTALLICMENTFWSRKGGKFVELFKKSFKLYVESGTRRKVEATINILINEKGGCLEAEDIEAKFYVIISEHFLFSHPEESQEKEKKFTFLQRLTRKLKIR